jgi:hypothetical protein
MTATAVPSFITETIIMTTATIRLACSECDRTDADNIAPEQLKQCKAEGWTGITEFRTFEESCRIYENPADAPAGHDVTAWYTYLGVCPDCHVN